MKEIQRRVADLPCYAFIKPHVQAKMQEEEKKRQQKKKSAKADNYYGVFINLVLCHHESEFMDVAMATLREHGFEPSVLMHDGCMIHGDHYPPTLTHKTMAFRHSRQPRYLENLAPRPRVMAEMAESFVGGPGSCLPR